MPLKEFPVNFSAGRSARADDKSVKKNIFVRYRLEYKKTFTNISYWY